VIEKKSGFWHGVCIEIWLSMEICWLRQWLVGKTGWVVPVVMVAMAAPLMAQRALTLEDRINAQEAIERVYYEHRIWPKENPQPKPLFEQMITRAQIKAKVEDYLKKSAALDKYWQRPITTEQLQAEIARMARGTKDPAILRELFAALHDDPMLVAECLARPVLADRLLHNWYSSDTQLHAEAREKAEQALKEAAPEDLAAWPEGKYSKVMYRLKTGWEDKEEPLPGHNEIFLDADEFHKEQARASDAGQLVMRETPEAFIVERTNSSVEDTLVLDRLAFAKRLFDAWWDEVSASVALAQPSIDGTYFALQEIEALRETHYVTDAWLESSLTYPALPDYREYHTAVWTGTEMIVWGGSNGCCMNTGDRYNPSTDTWSTASAGANCPYPRMYHTAVWTGTEMIIWGGIGPWSGPGSCGAAAYVMNTGGRYNPSTDTWVATSTGNNCPKWRFRHSAVWTGTEMIIWGGETDAWSNPTIFNNGGRYNPSSNSWVAISTGSGCPVKRYSHTAVWTGTEMIIWGGCITSSPQYTNTGGRYDPATDTWIGTSTGIYCPSIRSNAAAVWTGTEMIVWGGGTNLIKYNDGGRYDPATDSWTATSTGANCPSARSSYTVVWTEADMIVWGGANTPLVAYNDGGRYNPSTDTWAATSTGANCPSGRYAHVAVWTGVEMIIWGGADPHLRNTGGRYDPATDTWVPTSIAVNAPSARSRYTTVWTGVEMILWGGWPSVSYGGATFTNEGGLYNPTLDVWINTSLASNCPSPRQWHSAIWTGIEMVIWGGYEVLSPHYTNTGGRYNPSTDTWEATSTNPDCPSVRCGHVAVWTGAEMIIWGGGWKQNYI
jgi:N-acetylneuraminic acid mutarotase